MATQLKIEFPKEMFLRYREADASRTISKLEQEVEKLKSTIRTYKGHFTKEKKRKEKE